MAQIQIVLTADALKEPEIQWDIWAIVVLSGFVFGATLDLFSLWLYATYMNR